MKQYIIKILNILLIISIIMISIPNSSSFAETEELEKKQQAIAEIANTYLAEGENIQYNQTWREIGTSPERATTEDPAFLDCSSFVYSVYKQALGIKLPASSTATMMSIAKQNQTNKNYIPVYVETDTNQDISGINEKNLQPGDLIVYRKASSGHVMLYVGNGMIIHSTGSDSKWESNGSIRKMRLTELTEQGSSRYLLAKNSDGTYEKKKIAIIRVLGKYSGNLNNATLTRLQMPGVLIEKISDPANKHTVRLGQEIEYKIRITNNSSVTYNQFNVTDTIGSYMSYVQNSINYAGSVSGSSVLWNIQTLVPNQTITLSYKVKVGTDINSIGKEIQTSAKVGNIESNVITNIIGYGLSKDEKESIIETANKYVEKKEYVSYVLASGCTDSDIQKLPEDLNSNNTASLSIMGLVKALYHNALGIDLDFSTTQQVVDEIFEEYNVDDYTFKLKEKSSNQSIRNMLVSNFCGAKNSWGGNGLLDEHVPALYEKNLEVGDILLYRYTYTNNGTTSESGSACIYLGPQRMIRLTSTGIILEEGEEVSSRIEAIFKYKRFALLRPTLNYKPNLSTESKTRIGNMSREQKQALECNIENLKSNTSIKSSNEFAEQVYSKTFNADTNTIANNSNSANEKYLQIGDLFVSGNKINMYIGNGKIMNYANGKLEEIQVSDYKKNNTNYRIIRANENAKLYITENSKNLITNKISKIEKNTKATEYGNQINRIATRYYNNDIKYSISEKELDKLPESTSKIDSAGLVHNIYKQAFEIDLPSTATDYLSDANKKYRVSSINVSNISQVSESNFEKGDIVVYKYKSGTAEGKVTFMYIGNSQQIRVSSANGVGIGSFSSMLSSIQEHKTDGNLLDVAVIRPNQIYNMNKDETMVECKIEPGVNNVWNSEVLVRKTSDRTIKYNIIVENKSNVSLIDVPVTIEIPNEQVSNISSTSNYYVGKNGNKLTWKIANLSPNGKMNIDYEVNFNGNVKNTFNLINIPEIYGIRKTPYVQVIKTEGISSSKYNIEGKYIKKVQPKTKVSNLKEEIITESDKQILDNGSVIENNDTIVKTGMIVKVDNSEYTVIVEGDIDKNGKITINDLAKLRKGVMNTADLSEIEKLAGDMDYNDKITINDLANLRKVILNN